MKTQQAGPLIPLKQLTHTNQTPNNFWPPRVQCSFFRSPPHGIDFYFKGKYYDKMYRGPHHGFFYPNKAHLISKEWPGMPKSFTKRGFSGCYYTKNPETVHFFSGDEFVVFSLAGVSNYTLLGNVKK